MTQLWLVCYDVSNDKRRQKLAKLIEQRCQRVQYSVFECPISGDTLEKLLEKRWLKVLNLEEDSLRAYPLDKTAKEQTKVFGSPPPYEPPDYLIL
ncbi:MAG: CRISPR-associated endonuclease Cas2 [Oscillatoria sp. PMC 1051.18]|uniref:CRISPR-associated endonuclease Cas2 n=1 Tax=Oscillatoria salina TaxID=331517 RepID=UPI0013BD9B9B|nr:CRISPR-associated endonuclease Cas2 [Oscillatoria salina]MBZ8181466.1 CRISPR-associated endonuclease Cas2 [Oscillatoria salina IIICB1]MEC4892531.1 CRISPR-associated endonuclease Cas2 [Oscillatoria sp. PMC 1050.18]MEC5029858.1 CRISPR-associated endonuclease Cas2 [Oscillatoria sp. PMC 1051.18]NET90740.1 CRISPR-associated endonuclease Cas2 [Kamptonema sp. SIO1D9]